MSSAFFALSEGAQFGPEEIAPEATGAHASRANRVRAHVEGSLAMRFPGALTPTPRRICETMPTGIAALDAMLGAGLPIGAITELVGPLSSGRTGVAVRTVAAAMREGNMCAWVDASDAFDPESAAANGVCLEQLLWVRCGVASQPNAAQRVPRDGGTIHPGSAHSPQARAGQHPRNEVRGLDTAVGELLREGQSTSRRDRSIGTPGTPNRALLSNSGGTAPQQQPAHRARSFGPVQREEQVSSDRQSRRGRGASENHPALAESHSTVGSGSGLGRRSSAAKPWARLDQVLRATDLLLQAGGFRVLVLDLGSIAPEHALRIPLATWFRFRAAADAHRTVLLALTQTSCARSSAGLVVDFAALEPRITRTMPGVMPQQTMPYPRPAGGAPSQKQIGPAVESSASIVESIRYHARPLRQRFTPEAQPFPINQRAAPRPPQATWQCSAYPMREQA